MRKLKLELEIADVRAVLADRDRRSRIGLAPDGWVVADSPRFQRQLRGENATFG